ncbi:pentapeptide repeat-containing protein [Streptomyces sp. NPDC093598]|uniref:pentapeptide repeat-containing protein n=1 Tax=Streptomyces sp. NPDC093598 TaxID=3366046 RepID=UPI00382BE688
MKRVALHRRQVRARLLRRAKRIGTWALAAAIGGLVLIGLPWLVWRGPYLLDAPYINTDTVGDGTGSAALITGLRNSIVTCAAAIGAGVALVYTARTYRLTRRGQVTERFIKALERLDSEQMYVRVGGVVALEQIVQDDADQAIHAAQVIGEFVRYRAPESRAVARSGGYRPTIGELPDAPDADVQIALSALTRPQSRRQVAGRGVLTLTELHLEGAKLSQADLTGALLREADLSDAQLIRADMTEVVAPQARFSNADLSVANLTRAVLWEADLSHAALLFADLRHAVLLGADVSHADLRAAKLTSALLHGADLTGADLREADLREADLRKADFRKAADAGLPLSDRLTWTLTIGARSGPDADTILPRADLSKANLTRANLKGVDLTDAKGLTAAQVRSAYTGADTKLPPDLQAEVRSP